MKDLLRICDLNASGLHRAFVALDEAKEVSRHWGDALRGDGVVLYFSKPSNGRRRGDEDPESHRRSRVRRTLRPGAGFARFPAVKSEGRARWM